jgi:hypothetical protein
MVYLIRALRHALGRFQLRATETGDRSSSERRLVAYEIRDTTGFTIEPAERSRRWMDTTTGEFAYRCLPMLVANQAGWIIRNSHTVVVSWNGGSMPGALTIDVQDGPPTCEIISHFGYGILTWRLPYMFRTPPDYNLLARGPANAPKHGASPLEGVIETDWSVTPFTMNWQLTRSGESVTFEKGEAICMIVPQRCRELESFTPEVGSLSSVPGVRSGYLNWRESRQAFERSDRRALPVANRFQRHYLRGTTVDGEQAAGHQVKLRLKPFSDARSSGPPDRARIACSAPREGPP